MSARPNSTRRRVALLAALCGTAAVAIAAACGLATASAVAAAPSYTLVSGTAAQQAEDAESPAVSTNGRYVVFTGSFAGTQGVYRKDLQTGEVALVAGADAGEPALSAPNAGAPSVSGNGQYVSFTTTADLVPADEPQDGESPAKGCSSVYVRDMAAPIGQPGAYTLISALNGSSESLSYGGAFTSGEGCPGGGSAAAARVAISESGMEVAFTTDGSSDLTGACAASGGTTQCPTPAGQIAVRDIEANATRLVSQTTSSLGSDAPEPVPGGGALTDDESEINLAADEAAAEIGDSTAAISADGSTVAWMGIEITEQTPATSAEAPKERPDEYDEPLWRRIAAGTDSPTRRVTGGDDPSCGCAGPLDTQWEGTGETFGDVSPVRGTYIAYGPFRRGSELAPLTPQLSANGQIVAILSTQPATGQLPVYIHKVPSTVSDNAYVVDMAEGLTRSQALTRLTAWPSDEFNEPELDGPIHEIAISPSGTQVAFTTERIIFPYSPPALVTPALSREPDGAELYDADLTAGTLSLLSYGYEGSPANGAVTGPTFDGESELAFASGATNLIYGAYNRGESDVFLAPIVDATPEPGQQSFSPLPPSGVVAPEWVIGASAHSGPHGSVLVDVTVPAAGGVSASAKASVPLTVADGAAKHKDKTKRNKARSLARANTAKDKAASKGSKRSSSTDKMTGRTVASTKASAAAAGAVQLRLTPGSRYGSLVDSRDGLYATLTVTFTTAGHGALEETLPVEFKYTPKKAKKAAKKKADNKKSAKSKAGKR